MVAISLSFVISISLKAQTDTTVYHVVFKNGTSLYGQIMALEQGNYITIKKDGGGIQFLQWDEVKEYTSTTFSLTGKELVEIKKKEEIKRKYRDWESGLIITIENDTLHRWIKHKNDYSAMGDGESRKITVADEKGEESDVNSEEYKELIILGKDPIRYVSFSPKGKDFHNIYRIILDGSCRILQDHYTKQGGGGLSMGGAAPGSNSVSMMPYEGTDADRFYLSYKDKWLKVGLKEGFNISASFRDKCKEIFSDCPELVSQLEKQSFKSDDLKVIVAEFNSCVNSKPK